MPASHTSSPTKYIPPCQPRLFSSSRLSCPQNPPQSQAPCPTGSPPLQSLTTQSPQAQCPVAASRTLLQVIVMVTGVLVHLDPPGPTAWPRENGPETSKASACSRNGCHPCKGCECHEGCKGLHPWIIGLCMLLLVVQMAHTYIEIGMVSGLFIQFPSCIPKHTYATPSQ